MKPNELRTPTWTRALAALAAVAVAAMLSSCAHLNPPEPEPGPEPTVVEKKPPPEPIKPPPPSPLYDWWGKEYVSHVEVSIDEQKARFYSGDQMVGWTTVASGVHKYPTPTGSFEITEKVRNKQSNLYGKIYNKNGKLVRRGAKMGVHKIPAGGRFKGAPMPYFLRLTNDGIGMHAGPIPRPGNRASHGCIRMPKNFAPILYRHVDVGTAVTIKGNGPAYASYLSKQRNSAPKPAKTAVANAEPAPASTPAALPATATSEPVSASPQPLAIHGAAAPAVTAVPPRPTVSIAAPTPYAPALAPPAPSMAGPSAYTSAYQAPLAMPPAASAPTAPDTTAMGAANPRVYATPLTAPPAAPDSPAPSMSSAPVASPGPPIPGPAPAAPAPLAPQTPPPAHPAGIPGVASPSVPVESTAPQVPAPAAAQW